MPNLLIGRILDPNALGNVSSVEVTQDAMRFAGRITRADLIEVTHVRDQMLALVDNPDEPHVPLVYSGEPSLNSWVHPREASVQIEPGSLERGLFPWTLTVERLKHGAPRLESSFGGAGYLNDYGYPSSSTKPWHGIPVAAAAYDFGGHAYPGYTRTGPGGTATIFNPGVTYYSDYATFTLPPQNAYDMAATVRIGDFPNRRTVHGLRIPDGYESRWELNNGLLRVTAGAGSALLYFRMPIAATPGIYGTPVAVEIGYWSAFFSAWTPIPPTSIDSMTIIRNSPERCVVRLYVHFTPGAGGSSSYFTVDIALRRGARHVQCFIKSPMAEQWGIATAATTGFSPLNYGGNTTGMRRAANDGDGNRIGFSTSHLNTQDTVNGRMYSASNRTVNDFGIWGEIGGSAAVAPDDYITLSDQYFAAQTEQQRIILP